MLKWLLCLKNNYLRLKEHITRIRKNYDYIIIDCPPGIGLNVNVLSASDLVIIPSLCEFFSREFI